MPPTSAPTPIIPTARTNGSRRGCATRTTAIRNPTPPTPSTSSTARRCATTTATPSSRPTPSNGPTGRSIISNTTGPPTTSTTSRRCTTLCGPPTATSYTASPTRLPLPMLLFGSSTPTAGERRATSATRGRASPPSASTSSAGRPSPAPDIGPTPICSW